MSQEKLRFKCTNQKCGCILEVDKREHEKQESEKVTIFDTLLKMGAWGAVAVVALHFLAIVILACLVFIINDAFERNKESGFGVKCAGCGGSNFAQMDGGY